jgi:hypothetical protein
VKCLKTLSSTARSTNRNSTKDLVRMCTPIAEQLNRKVSCVVAEAKKLLDLINKHKQTKASTADGDILDHYFRCLGKLSRTRIRSHASWGSKQRRKGAPTLSVERIEQILVDLMKREDCDGQYQLHGPWVGRRLFTYSREEVHPSGEEVHPAFATVMAYYIPKGKTSEDVALWYVLDDDAYDREYEEHEVKHFLTNDSTEFLTPMHRAAKAAATAASVVALTAAPEAAAEADGCGGGDGSAGLIDGVEAVSGKALASMVKRPRVDDATASPASGKFQAPAAEATLEVAKAVVAEVAGGGHGKPFKRKVGDVPKVGVVVRM